MRTQDICQVLNQTFPLDSQEEWDNSGLNIDNHNAELTGILIAFDITEATLQEAIDKHCNFILAHHPLIFNALHQINDQNYIGRCVQTAIKNGIAIYCSHTPTDKSVNGISFRLATALQLKGVQVLSEEGFGCYGQLPQALSEDKFIALLKEKFHPTVIRCSQPLGQPIQTVALCGGSGAFLIERAKEVQADAYVCGDIKHHEYYQADGQILLADIGHFESEILTKEIFFELISKKFPNFAVHLSEHDKSPINCF